MAVLLRRRPWLVILRATVRSKCSQSIPTPKPVRVRFAPSPTGQLHIGGFRSALYNYLFAKSRSGGTFILRIEDTDQSRLVPGAAENLQAMLEWTGVVPDEGPSAGGDFGPYVQSERLDLYREAVDTLLAEGKAYRCFCSDRRLSMLKKEAAKARVANKYDGRCKGLTPDEIEENLSRGMKYTVRLDISNSEKFTSFQDLVFGSVKQTAITTEGDPIILKSDGFPTYHLANVVDDHHMKISHVFRGVEWSVSTPKHLLLFDALGWDPPEYGHLPLVMNFDGSKLSKRQGGVHVEDYKAQGYFPEAISNFITGSGGGFRDRDATDITRWYSLPDLADRFDHTLLRTNNTKLDFEKLKLINQRMIHDKATDPEKLPALLDQVKATLGSSCHFEDDEVLAGHLKWLSKDGRIQTFPDLNGPNLAFLWSGPKNIEYSGPITPQIITKVIDILEESQDISATEINSKLTSLAKAEAISFPALMKCLRTVMSGLKKGPPVGEMIENLGRETSIRRLQRAVHALADKNSEEQESVRNL